MGGEFALTGPGRQIANAVGDFGQSKLIGVENNGSDKSSGGGDGNTHINVGMGPEGLCYRVNGTVDFGHIPQCQGTAPDDKVIDRDFDTELGCQVLPQLKDGIEFDLYRHVKVWDLPFALGEATGDDLAHLVVGKIFKSPMGLNLRQCKVANDWSGCRRWWW